MPATLEKRPPAMTEAQAQYRQKFLGYLGATLGCLRSARDTCRASESAELDRIAARLRELRDDATRDLDRTDVIRAER